METVSPTFRSDLTVTRNLSACTGSDVGVAFAAWAIPPADSNEWNAEVKAAGLHGKDASGKGIRNVIRACMKLKHVSPFEHGLMSVYAELPGVAWWQITRQRFMSMDSEDFAFNLESGRYKHLDPEFYLPPTTRPMFEAEGFNPMQPKLETSHGGAAYVRDRLEASNLAAWEVYTDLISSGVAREVARLSLPNWSLYCDGYITAKPLTWLQFFSKRRATEQTETATFPQWETEQFAAACEELFAQQWPAVYAAFIEFGRGAP